MPDLVLQKPEEKSWIRYIRQRIRKNKNMLGFVSGPTGSGKSWASLSIAEMLDDDFCIDRVVFSALDLMNLICDGDLKSGSVIVFEEVGVALSHKNWQSQINQMISNLVQTFRHRNFILILNSPFLHFMDKSTRILFHAELSMISINEKNRTAKLKPQLLQYNSRMQKFYYKYLRIITHDKGIVPIIRWNIPAPSKGLIKVYEQKKRAYTDALNNSIRVSLQQEKDKDNPQPKELTEIQIEVFNLSKEGLTDQEIAVEIGKSRAYINRMRQTIANKGWKHTT